MLALRHALLLGFCIFGLAFVSTGHAQSPTAKSLYFDGADDYAWTPDSASLDLTSDMTAEAWVFYENDQWCAIVGKNVGFTYVGQWYFFDSPEGPAPHTLGLDRCGCVGGCDYSLDSTTAVPVASWHHVAVTYSMNRQEARFYVDGELAGTRTTTSCVLDTPYDLTVGWFPNTWIRMRGFIDELRLWDVNRSQSEIQAWMSTPLSGAEVGLVGYWRFDEGVGQIAQDLSPFGNHLILGTQPTADASDPTWSTFAAPISDSDCNGNGVDDSIDVSSGASLDCNANLQPDECEIAAAVALDCNGNGVLDQCDISILPGLDGNGDGFIDACGIIGFAVNPANAHTNYKFTAMSWNDAEALSVFYGGHLATVNDAAENAWIVANFGADVWIGFNDIAVEGSFVWSSGSPITFTNWIPGEPNDYVPGEDAALITALSGQWNDGGESSLFFGVAEIDTDCNQNLTLDAVEVLKGIATDCDLNGMIDECQVAIDPSLDCDSSGVLDACEITATPSLDCDVSGTLDACDILTGVLADCDASGIADSCELAGGTALDCNGNSVPDSCDVASGASADIDSNGIPDECQQHFIRGDCNATGVLDIADAVYLLNYLFASAGTPQCFSACDANDSGALDIADGIYTLAALFTGGPLPPAPYPFCGIVPTAGTLGCAAFVVCP